MTEGSIDIKNETKTPRRSLKGDYVNEKEINGLVFGYKQMSYDDKTMHHAKQIDMYVGGSSEMKSPDEMAPRSEEFVEAVKKRVEYHKYLVYEYCVWVSDGTERYDIESAYDKVPDCISELVDSILVASGLLEEEQAPLS